MFKEKFCSHYKKSNHREDKCFENLNNFNNRLKEQQEVVVNEPGAQQ